MEKEKTGLDIDRLGIIMATTMLAFSLTRVIPVADQALEYGILGIRIPINFNIKTLISIITGLLAAVGSDWIIRSHPDFKEPSNNRFLNYQHLIVPVFSAFVISITLNQALGILEWWIIFALGSIFFGLTLFSEYTIIDQENRHPFSSIGLVALTFALFVILTIAIRSLGSRVYLEMAIVFIGSFMVSLRVSNIRLQGQTPLEWIIIISVIMAQLAGGLHYISLNPTQFGLVLAGILYAMVSLVCGLKQRKQKLSLLLEPFLMMLVLGIFSFFV